MQNFLKDSLFYTDLFAFYRKITTKIFIEICIRKIYTLYMSKLSIFLTMVLTSGVFLMPLVAAETPNDGIPVTVTVKNVTLNGGKVFIAIYNSEKSHKAEVPDYVFKEEDTTNTVSITVSLPAGEYAFAVFQDTNNNEVKEPVALSNWSGKGLPGGWDKQKVQITAENNNNIVLQLQ